MSVDNNLVLARRWFDEVWNGRNYHYAHERMSPGCRCQGQRAEPMVGPNAFLFFARQIHAVFPDIRLRVEDSFGSGDKVVVRWLGGASHRGVLAGMAATQRAVGMNGISILQFEDGRAAFLCCFHDAGASR
jgi:predicted ester cyclase